MHQDRCVELARQAAVDCGERHDYMPPTPLLAEVWHPHRWVVDAMLLAADEAERERDSFKAGNTALLGALMDMVWQFVAGDDREAVFSHTHMAAEEGAIAVLLQAGMAEEVTPGAYRLLWSALEARKPKPITWAQAVNECVTDPEARARLLALD